MMAGGARPVESVVAAVTFDHFKAKHRKLDCSKCHTVSIAKPDITGFPSHVACASCHNFSEMATSKFAIFCGICHTGVPESVASPALFAFPKPQTKTQFGLTLSHVAHLKAPFRFAGPERLMKCMDCHIMVAPVANGKRMVPEMVREKGHANCFRCHGKKPDKPPGMNRCAGCHALGRPTPPHLYGIVPKFVHEDHAYDIRPKKKTAVAKKVDLCFDCHKSIATGANLAEIKLPEVSFCISCHNGKLGLPEALSQDVMDSLGKR